MENGKFKFIGHLLLKTIVYREPSQQAEAVSAGPVRPGHAPRLSHDGQNRGATGQVWPPYAGGTLYHR